MFLTIIRAFNEGLKGFMRNGLLSLATVFVLAMSLYVISIIYMTTKTANYKLKMFEDRINISVYFMADYPESEILKAKDELKNSISEIRSIEYISKEQALEEFKKSNAGEPVILQALEEIGDNPLLPSLVIKANEQNQYESIANAVNDSNYKENIFRINYGKNKDVIDRLNSNIMMIRRSGIAFVVIFSLIAVLITFNTIRMTIYTQRKEIEVKRLVGASNFFIRMPFIFEGILYGVIASIVSMLLMFVTIKFLAPYIVSTGNGEYLRNLFYHQFHLFFVIQIGIGSILGILSSWIAMRKYLKI